MTNPPVEKEERAFETLVRAVPVAMILLIELILSLDAQPQRTFGPHRLKLPSEQQKHEY